MNRARLLNQIADEMDSSTMREMFDDETGEEMPTAPYYEDLVAYSIVSRLQNWEEGDVFDSDTLRELAKEIAADARRLQRVADWLTRQVTEEPHNAEY